MKTICLQWFRLFGLLSRIFQEDARGTHPYWPDWSAIIGWQPRQLSSQSFCPKMIEAYRSYWSHSLWLVFARKIKKSQNNDLWFGEAEWMQMRTSQNKVLPLIGLMIIRQLWKLQSFCWKAHGLYHFFFVYIFKLHIFTFMICLKWELYIRISFFLPWLYSWHLCLKSTCGRSSPAMDFQLGICTFAMWNMSDLKKPSQ